MLLAYGVAGTPLLVVPCLVMAALLAARMSRVLDGPGGARRRREPRGVDDWPAFRRLTVVVVARSVLFFGLTSFLALHFIDNLGASAAQGGLALTAFLVAGAAGTLLGGWVADRAGRLACLRVGFLLAVPGLLGVLVAPTVPLALACVVVTGVAVYLPFSVFVVLGQDYLPQRMGVASGVTVGLAVSVGGLAAPLLGWLADATGLRVALAVLLVLPVAALVVGSRLHDPRTTAAAVR